MTDYRLPLAFLSAAPRKAGAGLGEIPQAELDVLVANGLAVERAGVYMLTEWGVTHVKALPRLGPWSGFQLYRMARERYGGWTLGTMSRAAWRERLEVLRGCD